MDSRDFLIIGAVAVAAFVWYRSRQPGGVADQVAAQTAAPAGVGASAMTASAAATTSPPGPAVATQVGPPLARSFSGFSALNMGGARFAGSTAFAIVSDAVAPPPPTPPVSGGWLGYPTTVGGGRVAGSGANTMGPQPQLTTIIPASKLTSPTRY